MTICWKIPHQANVEIFFCCLFAISWAALMAYGGSQARGPSGAVATGLGHSHSNAGIKAESATHTTAHGNTGSLTHWARPGIEPATSWFLVGFVNHCATTGTPRLFFAFYTSDNIIDIFFVFFSSLLNILFRSSRRGTAETNPTRNTEVAGSIPGLAQWVKDLALRWAVV